MVAVEKETQIAPTKNKLVNDVMAKIATLQQTGGLQFPPNYSPQNALMSAYLILQSTVDRDKRPVLQVCTQESIANSLLDMVVQGLSAAKKQGYFIAYGQTLTFQRSYFGTAAVAKRVLRSSKEPHAECIYEGDEFEYEILPDTKRIVKHVQKLGNIDKNKIIGAYATAFRQDGSAITEVMTIKQIHQAWRQSRQNPFDEKGSLRPDSVHGKFTDEMAKKTVLGRACKMAINTSDDSTLDLVIESINRTDDVADEAAFAEEVAAHANGEVLDVPFDVKDDEAAGEPAMEEQAEPEQEPVAPAQEPETEPKPQPEQAARPATSGRRRPQL